eukprot:403330894
MEGVHKICTIGKKGKQQAIFRLVDQNLKCQRKLSNNHKGKYKIECKQCQDFYILQTFQISEKSHINSSKDEVTFIKTVAKSKLQDYEKLFVQFDKTYPSLLNMNLRQSNKNLKDVLRLDILQEERKNIEAQHSIVGVKCDNFESLIKSKIHIFDMEIQESQYQNEKDLNSFKEKNSYIENLCVEFGKMIGISNQHLHQGLKQFQGIINKYLSDPTKSQTQKFLQDEEKELKNLVQSSKLELDKAQNIIENLVLKVNTLEKQQQTKFETISQKFIDKQAKIMTKLMSKKKKITRILKAMQKKIPQLQIPEKLPEAYNFSLKEMERRQQFNTFFYYTCEKIRQVSVQERDRRSQFNNKYGIYLPQNLVPKIQDYMPDFTYVLPNSFKIVEAKEMIQQYQSIIKSLVQVTFREIDFNQGNTQNKESILNDKLDTILEQFNDRLDIEQKLNQILEKRNEFIEHLQAYLKKIVHDHDQTFTEEQIERFLLQEKQKQKQDMSMEDPDFFQPNSSNHDDEKMDQDLSIIDCLVQKIITLLQHQSEIALESECQLRENMEKTIDLETKLEEFRNFFSKESRSYQITNGINQGCNAIFILTEDLTYKCMSKQGIDYILDVDQAQFIIVNGSVIPQILNGVIKKIEFCQDTNQKYYKCIIDLKE